MMGAKPCKVANFAPLGRSSITMSDLKIRPSNYDDDVKRLISKT